MQHYEKQTITAEDLYDLSMLEEMDDAEYLLEVLDLFLQETPKELKDLQEAQQSGNADALYKKAHKIKSSAGVIQAEHLSAVLIEIEILGKRGIVDIETKILVAQAIEEYRNIESSLTKYVDALR